MSPFLLTGGDELVDDGLCAVDEVRELCFPQHEGVGPLHGVAVLEAHGRELAEQGVVGPEPRLVAQVVERGPLLAVLPVDEDGVALHERAAAGVLPGQADRGALGDQGAEGEQLAEAPVDAAVARHGATPVQQRAQLRVRGEAFRWRGDRVTDPVHELRAHGGATAGDRRGLVLRLGARDLQAAGTLTLGACPAGVPGGVAHLGEHLLQLVGVVAQRRLGLLDGDVTATDQRLGVELAHRPLALDEVVHHGLGHRGVVALVVAAAAVADDVEDDVLAEVLAVLERQLRHPDAGLGVVAVHVEDRRLDHPGHIGRVVGGTACHRCGGEPDLVVDDDVDAAAGAVAPQLRQVERLGDHALARERRVAVDEDRKHRKLSATEVDPVLLGPRDPLQHRVDRLQVRRVGGEVDLGLRTGRRREGAFRPEVVLDVA